MTVKVFGKYIIFFWELQQEKKSVLWNKGKCIKVPDLCKYSDFRCLSEVRKDLKNGLSYTLTISVRNIDDLGRISDR